MRYSTPAQMQEAIDNYFVITDEDEWTVSGLSLLFGSKKVLYDYRKRPAYKEIIDYALLKVEYSYEKMMKKQGGGAGYIFALKNFGWKDTYDVGHSGDVTLSLSTYKNKIDEATTDEELHKIAGEQNRNILQGGNELVISEGSPS